MSDLDLIPVDGRSYREFIDLMKAVHEAAALEMAIFFFGNYPATPPASPPTAVSDQTDGSTPPPALAPA